jgi:hypothetical protein
VWGRVFVFFGNSQVRPFENKNFKESPGSSLLILKYIKNHGGSGFRNPKRGSYEVGVRVRRDD